MANFVQLDNKLSDVEYGHKLSCNNNYIISAVTFCIFKDF